MCIVFIMYLVADCVYFVVGLVCWVVDLQYGYMFWFVLVASRFAVVRDLWFGGYFCGLVVYYDYSLL